MTDDLTRYHEILGLGPEASAQEVEEAYQDLAKIWQPERFPEEPRLQEKAQAKLKELNEAYEKLKSGEAGPSLESSALEPEPAQAQPAHEAEEGQPLESPGPPPSPEPAARLPVWVTPSRLGIGLALALALILLPLLYFHLSSADAPLTTQAPESSLTKGEITSLPPGPTPPPWGPDTGARPDEKAGAEAKGAGPPISEEAKGEKEAAKEKPRAKARKPGKKRTASKAKPRRHFTMGSTQDEVLAIQGTPTSVQGNTWYYRSSSVTFSRGRVESYSNQSRNLRIKLEARTYAAAAPYPRHFSIGSTRGEVWAVQGRPTFIMGNTWCYHHSKVYFYRGRVIHYANPSGNLRARVY